MATDQHSISRRVVIGALAAAPTLVTASVVEASATGGALTDRSKATIVDILPPVRWKAVVQEYHALRAEWAAHPYGRTMPSSPDYERLEAEEGIIADRAHRALDVVLRTAAPNFEAFVEKLEIFEREFEHETDGKMTHLVMDARRLA